MNEKSMPAGIMAQLERQLSEASEAAFEELTALGFRPEKGFDVLAESYLLHRVGGVPSDSDKSRLKAALDLATASARLGEALRWFRDGDDSDAIGAAQVAVQSFILGQQSANFSLALAPDIGAIRPLPQEEEVLRKGRKRGTAALVEKKEKWQNRLRGHIDSYAYPSGTRRGTILDDFKQRNPNVALPTSDGPARFIGKILKSRQAN